MQKDDLAQIILTMTDSLYYISYGLLTNRPDQEDAVQECIRKALTKCDTLRDRRYAKTWVTRILINECNDILRKRRREIPLSAYEPTAPAGADVGLFAMISGLDEKLRLPLILHHYEGYQTREIAQILRIPEGTVKGRLVRARKALWALLQEEGVLA